MNIRQVMTLTTATSLVVVMAAAPMQAQPAVSLPVLGSYTNGAFNEGAAEIAAYDPSTQILFVTNAEKNTVDRLYIGDPSNPLLAGSIDLSPYGGGVNSVASNGAGIIAVAIEAANKQEPGTIAFFGSSGIFLSQVPVGALPDMVTFTPDGTKVLVANEGEPSDDYATDPEGSVSIINLAGGVRNLTERNVTTANFRAFPMATLLANGVRIFGPGSSAAQDIEPEYIAIAPDGQTAYVTLQENNAVGILDINAGQFTGIAALGTKDHRLPGNELDASDEDGTITLANFPVLGLYLPDAIATVTLGRSSYLFTANEGDSRDYEGFGEEARVADLTLDPTVFPEAAALQDERVMGRLKVTSTLGDPDGDGDYDALYAYGSRSFSVWDPEGNLIWDSGSQFEQIIAEQLPTEFNATNDENGSFDNRSDDKGPEPEGIALGQVGDRLYAFIGLERIGGIMVYDVSNPRAPQFVTYVNNRNFAGDPAAGTAGDLGPEGVLFIGAEASPEGTPLLVVTNEISGTTTLYSLGDL